jgi:hypothetical protein
LDDGRRSFLFGITVSEIAFILFFLLLLFSFFAIAGLEKENTLEEQRAEQEQARADEAEATLQAFSDAVAGLGDIDKEEALTILTRSAEAIRENEKNKGRLEELQAQNEELRQKERQAQALAKRSQRELGAVKGQLANVQERAKVGDPPCWVVDEGGEIEYLFRVKLFGNETVEVRREAPARRDAEYRALPSIPEITQGRLSMDRFKELSMPIYLSGGRSTPQCRHFVRLQFADREACKLFLIVERFYYKFVHEDDRSICPV